MRANFLDTNILLYLLSDDWQRADIAEALLREQSLISVQVLNEFANVSTRKFRLKWQETKEILAGITRAAVVVPLTQEVHQLGINLAERHKFHIYDAMIVAAALQAGCERLYTEDMQHGLVVAGRLHVINPFV